MKTIAVLLTVHNRKEKTLQCLENLYNQTIPEGYLLDVFLTDDGCTDGTRESVLSKFKEVKIVHGDGNLFWNRGMIEAWKEAAKRHYNFYLWLNDDTFLKENAVESLIRCSERNGEKTIIVGSCHASFDETRITYGGRTIDNSLISPDSIEGKRAVTFNGNIVLIPKAVYNELGTLDPVFHHSLGDFDYGLRATKKNITIQIVSKFLGVCDTHVSLPAWTRSDISLKDRITNFYSPTGANPREFFIYRKRHYGTLKACLTFCSNYIHLIFPYIWRNSQIKK